MARRQLRYAQLARQEIMQARESGGQVRKLGEMTNGEAKWTCATCQAGQVFPGTPTGHAQRDEAVASHHRDYPNHKTVPPAET